MSKSHYVYSTLSAGVDYTTYVRNDPKSPTVVEQVISVAGGANVVGKGPGLHTPRGVATKVTDEELEALQANTVFQMHVKNGFVTVSDKKADPENVATDLETRDNSAPLVDADFEADGMPAPIVGAPESDKPKGNPRRA